MNLFRKESIRKFEKVKISSIPNRELVEKALSASPKAAIRHSNTNRDLVMPTIFSETSKYHKRNDANKSVEFKQKIVPNVKSNKDIVLHCSPEQGFISR